MGEFSRIPSVRGPSTMAITRPVSMSDNPRMALIVLHGQVSGSGDPTLTMWTGDQGDYYHKLLRAVNLVLIASSLSFNVGAGSNPVNSWMNKASLLEIFGWFGPGNLLSQLGCRSDKAWFEAGSAGAQGLAIFGQNYPQLIGGATFRAASNELERDRITGGQSQLDINNAYARPVDEIGQVDVDGTATGHPTIIDASGLVTPAWFYGTSIKGEVGTPRAGEIVTPCHPPSMDIWRDQIIGAQGAEVDFYESMGDTTAGPSAGSMIPDIPSRGGFLHGSGRIWQAYVGATRHTVSQTAEHGEMVKFIPTGEIADKILQVA